MKTKIIFLCIMIVCAFAVSFVSAYTNQTAEGNTGLDQAYNSIEIYDDIPIEPDGIAIDTPGPPG